MVKTQIRSSADKAPVIPYSVSLDARTIATAEQFDDKNLSRGIRRMAERLREYELLVARLKARVRRVR